MTKDDIIPSRTSVRSMAREVGFTSGEIAWHDEMFERFAALIASRVAAASASVEREACAKVCDDLSNPFGNASLMAEQCAAAIRARGETSSRGNI